MIRGQSKLVATGPNQPIYPIFKAIKKSKFCGIFCPKFIISIIHPPKNKPGKKKSKVFVMHA